MLGHGFGICKSVLRMGIAYISVNVLETGYSMNLKIYFGLDMAHMKICCDQILDVFVQMCSGLDICVNRLVVGYCINI